MKKNLLMLALGVLMAGGVVAPAVAQDTKPRQEARMQKHKGERKSPEERAKARTERMDKELDLSKSQARKVETLNLKFAREKHALHANRGEARNKRNFRSEMKANNARYEAELKDILSKKQYAKYEADKAEIRAKHEQRRDSHKSHKGERQHRS